MAKKKRKSLLPKRIAGVKVPKAVRKGRFGELLASQTGRALLAEALMAAGALGAAKKAGDAGSDKTAHAGVRGFTEQVAQRLQQTGGKDGAGGAALAYALGEAARVFVTALNDHKAQASNAEAHTPAEPHDADAEGAWTTAGPTKPEASKKKRPPSPEPLPV